MPPPRSVQVMAYMEKESKKEGICVYVYMHMCVYTYVYMYN